MLKKNLRLLYKLELEAEGYHALVASNVREAIKTVEKETHASDNHLNIYCIENNEFSFFFSL